MDKVYDVILYGASEEVGIATLEERLRQCEKKGKGVDLDFASPSTCWTCLHVAAAWGWPQLVQRLLEAGANPDQRSKAGITPLHKAAAAGSMACVEKLLEFGASPLSVDKQHFLPWHYAAQGGHEQVALRLEDLEVRIEVLLDLTFDQKSLALLHEDSSPEASNSSDSSIESDSPRESSTS